VRSFAVETATENLVQNPQFLNGLKNYNFYTFGTGVGYVEVINNIAHIHNEDSTNYIALQQRFSLDTTKTYTLSARVRSPNYRNITVRAYFGVEYKTLGVAPASGEWVTLHYTYVSGEFTATPIMFFLVPPGEYLQVDWLQFEEKSFPTSFVDGSRPRGRFVIPVEDLKFDIANDDWVISCWKYPVATHDNTQNG